MIILEGPDCTGKSTFAEELRVSMKLGKNVLVHTGPPGISLPGESAAWNQYVDMLLGKKAIKTNAILDRFIYGELVYGPIVRGSHAFTMGHMRMLERVMFNNRAVVVFTRPPYAWAREQFKTRLAEGQEYLNKIETWAKVWDYYVRLAPQVNLPSLRWDPLMFTPSELSAQIKMLRPPVNGGPGHGMFQKGVTLIVGDFRQGGIYPDDWPMVNFTGSSVLLAQQLQDMDIKESRLYWVNSHRSTRQGDAMIDPSFVSRLAPSKIVGIGKNGAEWCETNLNRDCVLLPDVDEFYREYPDRHHPLVMELLR